VSFADLPPTSVLNDLRRECRKKSIRAIADCPDRTPDNLFGGSLAYKTTIDRKKRTRDCAVILEESSQSPSTESSSGETSSPEHFEDVSSGDASSGMTPPKNYLTVSKGDGASPSSEPNKRLRLSKPDAPGSTMVKAASSKEKGAGAKASKGKELIFRPVTFPQGRPITSTDTVHNAAVALGLSDGIILPVDAERMEKHSAEDLLARFTCQAGAVRRNIFRSPPHRRPVFLTSFSCAAISGWLRLLQGGSRSRQAAEGCRARNGQPYQSRG
jgi:hypothetical protein